MFNLSIPAPTEQQLMTPLSMLIDDANIYEIDSPAMYGIAADGLKQIKGKIRELDDQRKSITKPLDEAKLQVMNLFRRPLEALAGAEQSIKQKLIAYEAIEEQKRREEQERLAEIARKERERLQAEARKAEEVAAAKAVELRRQAEEARATDAALAAKLDAKADSVLDKAEEKADDKLAEARSIVEPLVARQEYKVKGISMRAVWHARVTDVSLVPREYLTPNLAALEGVAKATKGAILIPGVQIYSEVVAASGSR